jgi:hypothetical protein
MDICCTCLWALHGLLLVKVPARQILFLQWGDGAEGQILQLGVGRTVAALVILGNAGPQLSATPLLLILFLFTSLGTKPNNILVFSQQEAANLSTSTGIASGGQLERGPSAHKASQDNGQLKERLRTIQERDDYQLR